MPTQISLLMYLVGANLAQPKNHEFCNSWYSLIGCCSLGTGQKELELGIDRVVVCEGLELSMARMIEIARVKLMCGDRNIRADR